MNFLALVVVGLADYWLESVARFFQYPVLQKYINFAHKHARKLISSNFLFVILIAAVPAIIVGLVKVWLSTVLFGFISLLWSILVLLVCLTPVKFSLASEDVNYSLENLFAIFFWFAVLGPIGAVLYRVLALTKQVDKDTGVKVQADIVLQWFNILPVKLLGLTFALVGHFSSVFAFWLDHLMDGPKRNEQYLKDSFELLAIRDSDDVRSELLSKVIVRSLIVWLAVFALIVIF